MALKCIESTLLIEYIYIDILIWCIVMHDIKVLKIYITQIGHKYVLLEVNQIHMYTITRTKECSICLWRT